MCETLKNCFDRSTCP